jgi:hypothetical protein
MSDATNRATEDLIRAAFLVAGAPQDERQMLDFALTSLKAKLLDGFAENPVAMPSAAAFVQSALKLLMVAEIAADQDESEESS